VNSGEIKHTCSVLTVEGNNLLSTIHNNPKLKGPRMSLILENEQFDTWLGLVDEELTNNEIQ
jgi:putative SOS response-associated peptidase YedK